MERFLIQFRGHQIASNGTSIGVDTSLTKEFKFPTHYWVMRAGQSTSGEAQKREEGGILITYMSSGSGGMGDSPRRKDLCEELYGFD